MIRKLLFTLTILFSGTVFAKMPSFGVSGIYAGSIELDGKTVGAELKLVDHEGTLRGFLETQVQYIDVDGNEQTGTSIFVKGTIDASGKGELKFSRHHCIYVNDLCSVADRQVIGTAAVEFVSDGGDTPLFKVQIKPSNTSNYPLFSSGLFAMESGVEDSSHPMSSAAGVWDFFSFGAEQIAYPVRPSLGYFVNLTFFNIGSKWFRHAAVSDGVSGFNFFNEVIFLKSFGESEAELTVTTRFTTYHYLMAFKDAISFVIVREDVQANQVFDFEAVMFGFQGLDPETAVP